MEKELKELFLKNNNDIRRYEEQRDTLRSKLRFYSDHKLEEEQRIALIKLQAIEGVIYDYRDMINDLSKIITKK